MTGNTCSPQYHRRQESTSLTAPDPGLTTLGS